MTLDDIPDELTVTLRKPVTHANTTYSELRLREPTVADLKWSAEGALGMDQMARLIFKVAGVPLAAVDQLSVRDFRRCDDYLRGFTRESPPDGAPA